MAGSVRTEKQEGGSAAGSLGSRIHSMARRDQIVSAVFTVAMWIVLLFTYFAVRPSVPSAGVSVALLVSLVVLGVFNTASMIAMLSSYARDKDFIYREDIVNLDRNRRQKAGGRAEGER